MHRQTGSTVSTMTSTANVPGAPPSPTLTNPDMILPFDESPSQRQKFYGPYGDEDWSGRPEAGADNMQFQIGSAHSGAGPITPTTPIIYGNGTMLSDIGEVTEAESTVSKGRRLPGPAERRLLKQRQNELPLKSSPTVGPEPAAVRRAKPNTHQRKVSMDSNSTIRSEGRTTNVFADFDDNASVDDSVFLGDDEGSVADSYVEGMIASETQRLSRANDEDDDVNAALSKRAEEILQNAKLRLTNMEGNLSRARSTLGQYPNGSSIHETSPLNRSTPSPPTKLIPLQLGLPPSKRQLHGPLEPIIGSPNHSRGLSDNNVHSPKFNSPNLIRSASAAGRYGGPKHSPDMSKESPMSGFRNSLISPASSGRSASVVNTSRLEPLSENDQPQWTNGKGSRRSSLGGSSGSNESQPSRSASSLQVRELKDQMSDLKGRLSVLRDQARDDSMKRRSLQSLRTPSPFTAAEQWYTSAKGYGEGNLSADAVVTYAPWQDSPISPKAESPRRLEQPTYPESDVTSVYEDVSEVAEEQTIPIARPQELLAEDSHGEEVGIRYDTAVERLPEEDYGDEIISQSEASDYESDVYHDSFPTQVSHEDREDAFDYEHFFLHSAMGTISQQRNGRRGSYSSDDSVETTRGPITTNGQTLERRQSLVHLRNDSEASISTLATFATATEGFDDDDDDHDNFAVQDVAKSQYSRPASTQAGTKRSTFGSPLEALLKAKTDDFSRSNSIIQTREIRPDKHSRNGSNVSNRSGRQHTPPSTTSPVDMLKRDDQVLVENVVAAVGKCVLGLQDADSSSYEAKVWRRRLDAARRVLEGNEGAV